MSEQIEDNPCKKSYNENMRRSYEYRNRGIELKLKSMEILYTQLELLAEKAQNCLSSKELFEIQKLMAMLGQAIIPD